MTPASEKILATVMHRLAGMVPNNTACAEVLESGDAAKIARYDEILLHDAKYWRGVAERLRSCVKDLEVAKKLG